MKSENFSEKSSRVYGCFFRNTGRNTADVSKSITVMHLG